MLTRNTTRRRRGKGDDLGTDAQTAISTDSSDTLAQALNTNEDVQTKVEECADELGAVNAKMKEGFTDQVRLSEVQQVLSQSQDIESKVEACVDDLQALTRRWDRKLRNAAT